MDWKKWNSGTDYWNGGMLHRTYLIIQHVLYSEQYPITGNIRVVVVADRSTLGHLSLRTTYVYVWFHGQPANKIWKCLLPL